MTAATATKKGTAVSETKATTPTKKLGASDVAEELGIKPTIFRAWLRANGYQKQPGASYSFTRKEANDLKKAYSSTPPKPAGRPKKAKAAEQPEPVPAEDIVDEDPVEDDAMPDEDALEVDDDEDVEELVMD